MTFKPRHYHGHESGEPEGVIQIESEILCVSRTSLPKSILRLAYKEYHCQHQGQSFERIQQRGGFGLLEVVRLLADYVERLESEKGGGMKMQRSNFESALELAIKLQEIREHKEPMDPSYFNGKSAFLAGLKILLHASKAGEHIQIVGESNE